MDKQDIIRVARESGLFVHKEVQPELERFFQAAYAAGAAAEREACAKVCEEQKLKYEQRAVAPEEFRDINPEVARIAAMTCDFNAAYIRARGQA